MAVTSIWKIQSRLDKVLEYTTNEVKTKNEELVHNLEIDFIINVDKSNINVKLSNEHTDYKWVNKDSELLDEFIKEKLTNI